MTTDAPVGVTSPIPSRLVPGGPTRHPAAVSLGRFGQQESLTVSFTVYRLIGRPADSMTGNLGYGVIGSPADSGSVSLGSSPGTPANNARPRCLAA
jgi:hypothetical protein